MRVGVGVREVEDRVHLLGQRLDRDVALSVRLGYVWPRQTGGCHINVVAWRWVQDNKLNSQRSINTIHLVALHGPPDVGNDHQPLYGPRR